MKNTSFNNLRLGIFVLAGTVLLVVTLYVIGNKRNMFSSVFRVSANFQNVSGLVAGNNVRFAGIDVGTVEKIKISNDTSVQVTMVIRKEVRPFIKKTAQASLGTDGLMGNSIINISTVNDNSPSIEEGDVIGTAKSLAVSDMLKTLNRSNDNLVVITQDLKEITHKFNTSRMLDKLLSDEALVTDLNQTARSLKTAGLQLQASTADINSIVSDVKTGKGNIGVLLRDSSMALNLSQTMLQLKNAGDTLAQTIFLLKNRMEPGRSAIGTVLSDTAFDSKLNQAMDNVEQGTARFNESMEALKHNFLLRGYFKRQEKQKAKKQPSATQ
jgi:phospholipid/cholesterol/gamma-HCH transport system substrate-binding protein